MGKYQRKGTKEEKCGKETNLRTYQPPYSPPASDSYRSNGDLDRISGPSPLERISTVQDPLDRISGPSPLERISTTADPLDRISTTADPLDRISYGSRRRRY